MKDDLIERANAAIALGDKTGARGKSPTNIYNIAAELAQALKAKDDEIAKLREALKASGKEQSYLDGFDAAVKVVNSISISTSWGPKATLDDALEFALESVQSIMARARTPLGGSNG